MLLTQHYTASQERPRYFLDSADPPASEAQTRSLGGGGSLHAAVLTLSGAFYQQGVAWNRLAGASVQGHREGQGEVGW